MPVPTEPPPVQAAGGLLWRHSSKHGIEVALVHRPRYKDWSLPKGKATPGETAAVTAWREIREETGHDCTLGRRLTTVRYRVTTGPKQVEYFAAHAGDGSFTANREVDELRWVSMTAARSMLSYEFDVVVLDTFAVQPAPLTTLLLVRHARAGQRESWEGTDRRRPLDAKGKRQAAALRVQLGPFGPRAVFSAPIERCRATVAPLARSLRTRIRLEESLTEDTYRDNPSAARKLLSYLAKVAEPAVVCSQGGVIPGVVKSLASRSDLTIASASTAKSGYWALTFDGKMLVQADAYAPPAVS